MAEPKAIDDDQANKPAGKGEPAPGKDKSKAGEGDGAAEEPGADSSAADSGSGIDGTMRIDIDLLTYEVCLRIAEEIAKRCAAHLKPGGEVKDRKTLFVSPPGAAAAVARAQALAATLTALRDQMVLLARGAEAGGGGADTESAASLTMPALKAGIDQASALLGSIKGLLEMLAVVDVYDSRNVTLPPATVAALTAARCLQHKLRPVVISDGDLPLRPASGDGIVESLMAAAEKLRFASLADEASADAAQTLLTRADEAITALRDPEAGAPLALLELVSAHRDAPLLTVELLAAGGSYRTRTHLFTALGLAERLSVSAGAAIRFALTEATDGTLLDGDLLFDSSGHVRPPRTVAKRRIGNLASASGEPRP